MDRIFGCCGTILALLAVGAGSFGAHGLENVLTVETKYTFEVAVRYQMYHALGLFAVAWAAGHWPDNHWFNWAGWLLIAGNIIFSGSLYVLVFTQVKQWGMVTPFGGIAFLIGWLLLAIGFLRTRKAH